MLINCKDFLRLRSGTLQDTLKLMCPFGEIFYLADSLLIPLQSLSSFWRPNITVKANPPLSPYSPFHLLSCLHCHKMPSCWPEIPPESQFPTTIVKNTQSPPENNPTPIKWWACDQPLDFPKHLDLIFVKILESRTNALLVLVLAWRSPVHPISRGQIVCLCVEDSQPRGSTSSPWKPILCQGAGPRPIGISTFQWISLFFFKCPAFSITVFRKTVI